MTIKLDCQAIKLPFKTSFAHASADRAQGQSLWVTASEDEHIGVGEGCPRLYVTGETLEGALEAFAHTVSEVEHQCTDLKSLRAFTQEYSSFIDRHPSMWCAVEGALLDLFARRTRQSVDELLGMNAPSGIVRYSAVVGAQASDQAQALIDTYAKMAMQDYKLKIVHDTSAVHAKIGMIQACHRRLNLPAPRVRLDANNLWQNDSLNAARVLEGFKDKIVAVEEPLAAHAVDDLSTLSKALEMPIILDESVCKALDFEDFSKSEGHWIVNIKISKFGGILRTISFLEEFAFHRSGVVLGAHVGESSVLTRAAHTIWRWLGGDVMALEGGFGERLLERDMTQPSVEFGSGGLLDLKSYAGPGWGVEPRDNMYTS